LELDGCYACPSTGKESKEEGHNDRIEKLLDEDDKCEAAQGDSSAAEEEDGVMEEERDVWLDQEERKLLSAVARTQTEYAFVDMRRNRMDHVTRVHDEWARMEEEVLEVLMSDSNQEKCTIRKAITFSKQLAKVDPMENTTPKTPKTLKVPRK